jgi:dihydroflavonol-4-reductase
MRVLVTGATGFLGNNIVRTLLQQGHKVTIAKRVSSDPRTIDGLDIESVDVDLTDRIQISPVVADVDLVIHAAAMIQLGWSKLAQSRRVNVEGTRTIAASCRRNNIRMLHISSVDALAASDGKVPNNETYLNPAKPSCAYVVSKRESEIAFLDQVDRGLDGVILSPGFMVGPNDWRPSSGEMMLAIWKQWLPFAPGGGCSVADVRDVAVGVVSAIEHGRVGQRYILGGDNITYFNLWTEMARVMDRPRPKFVLPNWIAELAGRGGDLAAKFLKHEPQVNSAATRMGQLYHWYDSSKAEQELGYQWQPLTIALEDAWKWFQQHNYHKRR